MLSSHQCLSDLCNFFPEHPLMDYSGCGKKSANLHNADSVIFACLNFCEFLILGLLAQIFH